MFSCETHSHHSLLATRAKTVAEKTPYKRFGNNDKKEVRSSQRVRTPSRLARRVREHPRANKSPAANTGVPGGVLRLSRYVPVIACGSPQVTLRAKATQCLPA